MVALRGQTGYEKFCENFELAAERAREYRNDRPPKLRWRRRDQGDEPSPPSGGLGDRPPKPAPSAPEPAPDQPAAHRRN
ncbi:MAG: hypothetical protein E6I67_02735 [Chloroflexi bacterium]|nr:MAG: hypothetical protein E6I67_02735 [Chloroflexota bacterium]